MANYNPQTNPNSLANLKKGKPNPKWVKGAKEPSEAGKKGTLVQRTNMIIAEALKEYFLTHPEDYVKYNEIMVTKALNGDTKAWEIVRDTIGQKPKEAVDISSDNKIEINLGKIGDII